jgi:hypothetical protein
MRCLASTVDAEASGIGHNDKSAAARLIRALYLASTCVLHGT